MIELHRAQRRTIFVLLNTAKVQYSPDIHHTAMMTTLTYPNRLDAMAHQLTNPTRQLESKIKQKVQPNYFSSWVCRRCSKHPSRRSPRRSHHSNTSRGGRIDKCDINPRARCRTFRRLGCMGNWTGCTPTTTLLLKRRGYMIYPYAFR